MLARPLVFLLVAIASGGAFASQAAGGPRGTRFELKFQIELDNSTIQKVESQQQIFKCQVKLANQLADAVTSSRFRLKSSSKPIERRTGEQQAGEKWPANVSLAIDWFKDERPLVHFASQEQVTTINVDLRGNSSSGGLSNDKRDYTTTGGINNYGSKNKSRIEIKNTLNGQQMKLTSRLKLSQLKVADTGRYKCVARALFQVPIRDGDLLQQQHHQQQQLLLVEQTLESNGVSDLMVANKTVSTATTELQADRQGAEVKLQSREKMRGGANRLPWAALARQRANETQHASHSEAMGQQGESPSEVSRLESLRRRQKSGGHQELSGGNPSNLFVDDEDLFKMEQQEIISNQLQQSFAGANTRPSNDYEDQDEELGASSRRRLQSSVPLATSPSEDLMGVDWAAPQPTNGNDIQPDDTNSTNSNTRTLPINQSSSSDNADDNHADQASDLVIGLRRNTPQQQHLRPTTTTNYAPFGTHKETTTMDSSYFSGQLDSTRLRLAKLVRKIATDELSCYTGLGEHYRGNVSTSADKRQCLSWLQVRRVLGPNGSLEKLGASSSNLASDNNHNHCRNPNMEPQGPWCFVQYSEALDANLIGEHFVLVSAGAGVGNDGWNSTGGLNSAPSATRYVQRSCSISPCSDYLWLYIVAPPFGLLAVLSCLILFMVRAMRKSRYQSMMIAKGKRTLPSKLNKLLMGSSRLGAPAKKYGHKSAGQAASKKKLKSCPNYLDDDIFEIVNDIDWSDGSQVGGQALTLTPKSAESLKLHSSSFGSNCTNENSGNEQQVTARQPSGCKSTNPLFNDKTIDQQRAAADSNRSMRTTTSQVGPMFATLRCQIRENDGKQTNSTSTFIENCKVSTNTNDDANNKQPLANALHNTDWLSPSSPDSDSSPETSGVAMDFSCESKQTGSHLISCSNTTDDIEAIDCCGEKYTRAIELPQLDASSVSICTDQQQLLYEGKFSQVRLAYLKQLGTSNGGTSQDFRDIGAQVAVCSLKSNSANAIDPKLFKPMNLRVRNLNHLNLLKLIGYSHIAQAEIGLNQSPRLAPCCSLVYDMARLVDLSDWLKQQNKDLLMSEEPAGELGLRRNLTCFAKQIALAIDYLHDLKIIYRDLTCRNCFLDPTKMLVKLASFNLELVINQNDQQAQSLKSMIRPKYLHDYYVIESRPSDCQLVSLNCIPLESILFNKFNRQTDVWSFGCLIYELFSFGEAAYFGYSSKQVIDAVRANLMPPQPLLCPNGIYKLMCKCLSDIPNSRPNVKQIYEQLNLYSGQCSSFLDHHLCSLTTNMYDDQLNGGLVQTSLQVKSSQLNMCNNAITTTTMNKTNNLFIATTSSGANTSSRDNSITKTKSYANIKNCSSQPSQGRMHNNSSGGLENQMKQGVISRPEFGKIPMSKSINLGTGSRLMCYGRQTSQLEANHYDEPVVD